MRIVDYSTLIKEDVSYLEKLLKGLSSIKLRDRCEVLIWLKSGKVSTMKQAVSLKGYSVTQGQNWWKEYKTNGVHCFLQLHYQGQKSPLREKKELEERLCKEGFATINEAKDWIFETYGIQYTENGLGNYFRLRKIKLKTGRPTHPKKDAVKREAYKKNIRKN